MEPSDSCVALYYRRQSALNEHYTNKSNSIHCLLQHITRIKFCFCCVPPLLEIDCILILDQSDQRLFRCLLLILPVGHLRRFNLKKKATTKCHHVHWPCSSRCIRLIFQRLQLGNVSPPQSVVFDGKCFMYRMIHFRFVFDAKSHHKHKICFRISHHSPFYIYFCIFAL